ncbi:MAG: L-threonylcarbamoyladenylate synthase [Flavobacteriaceae bacterium]|nr:L-threonylcarbamoyladenylate synthase [Flavobacteriaceae bacterium]
MNLIEIYSDNPNPKQIDIIIDVLKNDGVIIYPTDTVYAIGCLSNSSIGLKKLLRLKSSKADKLILSFIFKDISTLSGFVKPYTNKIFRILNKCFPGPYTFIMNAQTKLPTPFQKRQDIGVRISRHPIVKSILNKLDIPLVTSSLHDKNKIIKYTTDPKLIYDEWSHKVDLIIDGGNSGNIPSTVIDIRDAEPVLIRKGKGGLF